MRLFYFKKELGCFIFGPFSVKKGFFSLFMFDCYGFAFHVFAYVLLFSVWFETDIRNVAMDNCRAVFANQCHKYYIFFFEDLKMR